MIAVRKYRMAVANRKKYGEVKKVEQTSTINGTFHSSSSATTLDLTKLSSAEIRAALAEQLSLAQGMRELSSPEHPSEHPSDLASVPSFLLGVDDGDPGDEEAIDG